MNAPVWMISVGYALFIILLAFAAGKWFKVKGKEVKDGPECPLRHVKLTRHETVFGHCFSCPFRDIRKCRLKNADVKS
jgi:hypothetical protein